MLAGKPPANSNSSIKQTKRKISFYDRLFSKPAKRAKTSKGATTADSKMTLNNAEAGTEANAKKSSKLDKKRKKDVKERLNEEARSERYPLAIGTVAMMASSLANQGRWPNINWCCMS